MRGEKETGRHREDKKCNGVGDAQTHTDPGETAELTDRQMTEEHTHVKSKTILVSLIVSE